MVRTVAPHAAANWPTATAGAPAAGRRCVSPAVANTTAGPPARRTGATRAFASGKSATAFFLTAGACRRADGARDVKRCPELLKSAVCRGGTSALLHRRLRAREGTDPSPTHALDRRGGRGQHWASPETSRDPFAVPTSPLPAGVTAARPVQPRLVPLWSATVPAPRSFHETSSKPASCINVASERASGKAATDIGR